MIKKSRWSFNRSLISILAIQGKTNERNYLLTDMSALSPARVNTQSTSTKWEILLKLSGIFATTKTILHKKPKPERRLYEKCFSEEIDRIYRRLSQQDVKGEREAKWTAAKKDVFDELGTQKKGEKSRVKRGEKQKKLEKLFHCKKLWLFSSSSLGKTNESMISFSRSLSSLFFPVLPAWHKRKEKTRASQLLTTVRDVNSLIK